MHLKRKAPDSWDHQPTDRWRLRSSSESKRVRREPRPWPALKNPTANTTGWKDNSEVLSGPPEQRIFDDRRGMNVLGPLENLRTKGSTIPTARLDRGGFHVIDPGFVLGRSKKYRVDRYLGSGAGSSAFAAHPIASETITVVLKVIRQGPSWSASAAAEVNMLKWLRKKRGHLNSCVEFLGSFHHETHLCIVTALAGQTLDKVIITGGRRPLSLELIKGVGRRTLSALRFLHSCGIVHADVKPENIAISFDPAGCLVDLRLIDFGSAIRSDDLMVGNAGTLNYRAPEMLLGLGWSYPLDLFSFGCTLMELSTGLVPFLGVITRTQQLAMLEALCGRMPSDFAKLAKAARPECFTGDRTTRLAWPPREVAPKAMIRVDKQKDTVNAVKPIEVLIKDRLLRTLVKRLLSWDAAARGTAQSTLEAPFFRSQHAS